MHWCVDFNEDVRDLSRVGYEEVRDLSRVGWDT